MTWLAVTYICLKSNFCDFVGCNLSASFVEDAYSYPTLFKPILTRCRYFYLPLGFSLGFFLPCISTLLPPQGSYFCRGNMVINKCKPIGVAVILVCLIEQY